METNVLCTLRFTDEQLSHLRAASPHIRLSQQTCHSADEVAAALADYPTVEAFCAEAWSPDLADFCQAQPLPVPDVNPYYELICNLCAAL